VPYNEKNLVNVVEITYVRYGLTVIVSQVKHVVVLGSSNHVRRSDIGPITNMAWVPYEIMRLSDDVHGYSPSTVN
jgi:hypothetical protein